MSLFKISGRVVGQDLESSALEHSPREGIKSTWIPVNFFGGRDYDAESSRRVLLRLYFLRCGEYPARRRELFSLRKKRTAGIRLSAWQKAGSLYRLDPTPFSALKNYGFQGDLIPLAGARGQRPRGLARDSVSRPCPSPHAEILNRLLEPVQPLNQSPCQPELETREPSGRIQRASVSGRPSTRRRPSSRDRQNSPEDRASPRPESLHRTVTDA